MCIPKTKLNFNPESIRLKNNQNKFVSNFNKQTIIMTTTLLKEHIAKAVKDINDKDFLEAVFTIVSNKADETDFQLTKKMKTELDARKEKHKDGTSKSYSWQNVKKEALKIK